MPTIIGISSTQQLWRSCDSLHPPTHRAKACMHTFFLKTLLGGSSLLEPPTEQGYRLDMGPSLTTRTPANHLTKHASKAQRGGNGARTGVHVTVHCRYDCCTVFTPSIVHAVLAFYRSEPRNFTLRHKALVAQFPPRPSRQFSIIVSIDRNSIGASSADVPSTNGDTAFPA